MVYKIKIMIIVVLLWLLSGTVVFALDENIINETNWLTHPKIEEIRAIYNKIENEIKTKNIIEFKKTFEYEKPYEPTLKIIYIDKSNIVRKYIEEAGSDDSELVFSYYYDDRQVLRFTFIHGGAVNGSEVEHRIYFDSSGKRIWEIQKYIKGPGYTFPKIWPKENLVFKPLKEFL